MIHTLMVRKLVPPFIVVFILSLAYGKTLAASLSWANGGADGGDLITAAATGGVAHPPGYPLYLLFAQCFQLLPIGTLAFRTNLLSAICTLLACILFYKFLVKQLEAGLHANWIALVSALAFGLAPQVWEQAVITEVYGLHALLIVLILLSLYTDNFPAGDFGRGFLVGLAAGNHFTILFLFPLVLLNYKSLNRSTTWRRVSFCSMGLFAGLAIYLTLPVRALLGSPVNWYNPVTAQNFWNLISAQLYGSYLFSLSLADSILRIRALAGLLLYQYTLWGIVLGLYGLLSRPPRMLILISTWIFLIYSIFSIVYGSYDSQVYLIPAYLVFAVWIAYGLQDLLEGIPPNVFKNKRFILVVLAFGLLARIPFYIDKVDASQDHRADDFGRQFALNVPIDALVLAREDREIFALWYFHFALGQRSDVTVIAEGLLQFDWYLHSLAQTYPDLVIPSLATVSSLDLISANPTHAVCNIDESGNCR